MKTAHSEINSCFFMLNMCKIKKNCFQGAVSKDAEHLWEILEPSVRQTKH